MLQQAGDESPEPATSAELNTSNCLLFVATNRAQRTESGLQYYRRRIHGGSNGGEGYSGEGYSGGIDWP